MRDLLIVAVVTGLALPAGSQAHAQSGQVRTGSARAPRAAAMPAPVERQAPSTPGQARDYDRRDDRRDDHRDHHRRAPRYVILGDGTVLADLGYGYEQAIRSCASQRVVAQGNGTLNAAPNPNQHAAPNPNAQPVPTQAAPYQPPVYTPPVYTPPVYTPPATSNTSYPAGAACWTTDRDGQVVIVRQ
jgi:hypothetical protein